MTTVYNGQTYSTIKFEDLKLGDTFIVDNPVSGPNADTIVYLKIQLQLCGEDTEPCAVVLRTGRVIIPTHDLPVIRVDGKLYWKMRQ